MEERVLGKPYVTDQKFEKSRGEIYDYTVETFGEAQAERYLDMIKKALITLPTRYNGYPECLDIPTKSRMYRRIVVGKHFIIYRITKHRIEVLDIVHSASGVGKIRSTRSIRIPVATVHPRPSGTPASGGDSETPGTQ